MVPNGPFINGLLILHNFRGFFLIVFSDIKEKYEKKSFSFADSLLAKLYCDTPCVS